MDECVNDMTPPSPTNDADFVKHLASNVFLSSGKWVAKIRHPIRKVWVCLGIYNNHEEAADAYARKKLEYESQSVQEMAASFNTNVADFEKHPGVKRMASGKWGANIKHKKVSVWLGSYNTLNEAADAFDLSKLELQSPKVRSLTKAGAREALNQKKCELVLKDGAEQSERNQRQRHAFVSSRSGRCRTEISLPMKKGKKICLGAFDTDEEAKDTYDNMMRQFDLNHQQSNEGVYSGTLTEEGYNNKMCEVDLMVRDHENCKLDSGFGSSAHIREVETRGTVYQAKSGKWKAEIQIINVKHKLGTYATAEEALNKKKCEPRQLKGSCEAVLIAEGKSDSDDPFVSANEASREEDGGGSIINVNVESVTKFVKEEKGEFDLGVIDSCGQLVGEYSKMDDELWIG